MQARRPDLQLFFTCGGEDEPTDERQPDATDEATHQELCQAQHDQDDGDDAPGMRRANRGAHAVAVSAPQISTHQAAAIQWRAGQQIEQPQHEVDHRKPPNNAYGKGSGAHDGQFRSQRGE